MANHPNRSLPPLARTVRDWMGRAGLTVAEAAPRIGVEVRTLENWCAARTCPRSPMAALAAQYIDTLDR